MFVVEIVSAPELEAECPSYHVFGETTKDEGSVSKYSASSLLVEVPVSEHRGVSIEVSHGTGASLKSTVGH